MMADKRWTAAETLLALNYIGWGFTYTQAAAKMGRSRSAIAGVVKRAKAKAQRPEVKLKRPPVRFGANFERATPILPAKYPYAADCSCPEFAHDDLHTSAVLREREIGFPVMPAYRRAA